MFRLSCYLIRNIELTKKILVLAGSADTALWSRKIDTAAFGAIEISAFERVEAIEAGWRTLQNVGTVSAYQRYEWIREWMGTLGPSGDQLPRFILATHNEGTPLFILPWAVSTRYGLRRVGWLADSHSNFRMGLFSKPFLTATNATSLSNIVSAIGEMLGDIDAIILNHQPHVWNGDVNPFALLPAQPSNNPAFALTLERDFKDTLKRINGAKRRKKHRWQMNQLGDPARVDLQRATTPEQIELFLDIAFAQMADRFEVLGVRNVFSDTATQRFFKTLANTSLQNDHPAFTVFALSIDNKIRATLAGGLASGVFSASFISIADDELMRLSPGELLIYKVVEHLSAEGLSMLDFGRGRERYKTSWCDTTIEMFETHVPLTAKGRLFCMLESLRVNAKRTIRNNGTLWNAAKAIRGTINRMR